MIKLLGTCLFKRSTKISRSFSTTKPSTFKVTIIGAAGGIGQPLSLLMKRNLLVKKLALYDLMKHIPGVAADVSHLDYPAKVTSHLGPENLAEALKGANLVVIPAGVPRKPGMTRDDLFSTNAKILKEAGVAIAQNCPDACILIVTNPINAVVPIFCETLKKNGKLNPNKVFGVTTLDLLRSSIFIADLKKLDPRKVKCPCIGGHAGITILPLISQCEPKVEFKQDELEKLTKRIQNAGTEVVKAKAGAGSATLSTAEAAYRLAKKVLKGLNGESPIVYSYVKSDLGKADYFSSKLQLGKNGVEKNLGIGKLSPFEEDALKKLIPDLQKSIKKGIEFAAK